MKVALTSTLKSHTHTHTTAALLAYQRGPSLDSSVCSRREGIETLSDSFNSQCFCFRPQFNAPSLNHSLPARWSLLCVRLWNKRQQLCWQPARHKTARTRYKQSEFCCNYSLVCFSCFAALSLSLSISLSFSICLFRLSTLSALRQNAPFLPFRNNSANRLMLR